MKIISSTIYEAFVLFVLASFALLPKVQAVVPAPDGGYPNANTAEGQNALFSLTSGGYNTAVGYFSLRSNTESGFNTAIGAGTLLANTADNNTATGAGALLSNTTGGFNTATGALSLLSNTTGFNNTAIGFEALRRNTTGYSNTATGNTALSSNTTGFYNIAYGGASLLNNTTGDRNTAIGDGALANNTTGGRNTATGFQALESNTAGNANTAIGRSALGLNTTGGNNTALGFAAGDNVTTADNVICIGANVEGFNVSNSCFIGNIRGVTTQNADAMNVVIDSNGQLGTMSSSRRFKKEIKPMDQTSEAILALNPVTFHYKSDTKDTPQFGLIAEDVAAVNPSLVVRDKNGEIYTVRYDAVNAMLLNEFLKEHRAFLEEQGKVERLEKQVAALTTGLQKVSAELEANRAAPQTAANNQ